MMKAMLLAAGFGERMRPLTDATPKSVLPVLGRPMAVQILERLAAAGVRRAVVNLHHLPRQVRSALGDGDDLGLEALDYSEEETILGTGGGLRNAAPLLAGDGAFLVHNSDFLSDVDIESVMRAHERSGKAATLVLAPAREPYTPVETDADGTVVAIGGRPGPAGDRAVAEHLFTGLHVLDETLLARLPDGPSDVVRDLYYDLVSEGGLGSFVHEGFWWEFGSPAAYLEGTFRMLDLSPDARDRIARTDPVSDLDEARAAIGEGTDFHTGVSLIGRVALGMAVRVGEGSEIEQAVVMPGAWIGPGCRLRHVIVGPGVELPAGFDLEESVVCAVPRTDDEELPDGSRRQGDLLITPIPVASDRSPST